MPELISSHQPILKQIPGFPDYLVSNFGEVYSTKPPGKSKDRTPTKPRLLKKQLTKRGDYYSLGLRNGKVNTQKIGRLVLNAFVGPPPPGTIMCHGPRGSLVDTLENLYWGTHQQNSDDQLRDGTRCRGSKHQCAKVNELQVRVMRRAWHEDREHVSTTDLANIFGVSRQQAYCIVSGQTWRHI